jgi:hypothetical protein
MERRIIIDRIGGSALSAHCHSSDSRTYQAVSSTENTMMVSKIKPEDNNRPSSQAKRYEGAFGGDRVDRHGASDAGDRPGALAVQTHPGTVRDRVLKRSVCCGMKMQLL